MRSCRNCEFIYVQTPIPILELCERVAALGKDFGHYGIKLVKVEPVQCPECGETTNVRSLVKDV